MLLKFSVTISVPDPDPNPPDSHVFGPSGSICQRGMDPDPSVIMQKSQKDLDSFYFVTLFDFLSLKNYVKVPSNSYKQKKSLNNVFLLAS